MIVHCTTFLNEWELLRIQFLELADVVDFFLVSEGNFDWAGNPKPFNLGKTREMPPWCRVIKCDLTPYRRYNPLARARLSEIAQREAFRTALFDLKLSDDDVIWIADIDNIPKPQMLKEFAASDLEIASVTCSNPRTCAINAIESGTLRDVVFKFRWLKNWTKSINEIRNVEPSHKFENGMWVYAYMLGPKALEEKIRANSTYHANGWNFSNETFQAMVRDRANRDKIFREMMTLTDMENDHDHPLTVLNDLPRYVDNGWIFDPLKPSKIRD